MTSNPDYFELETALQKAGADYSVTEAQAIACGILSVNISADKIAWVQLIFGEIDSTNTNQEAAIKLSGDLFEFVKQQLQDSNLTFELLLPGEKEPLNMRVTAMQEWCTGYLLGINMAGVSDYSKLPEDSRELLADFTEIGTSRNLDIDDVETSEEALEEITEYIRMGVLLINEELQPLKQTTIIH